MLIFKKIDVFGQLCICVYVIGTIVHRYPRSFNILYLYYIMGLWQAASAIMHFAFVQFRPVSPQRKFYQIFAAVSLIVLVIAFLKRHNIFDLLMLILFTSPILAVWYTYISYKELKMWLLDN